MLRGIFSFNFRSHIARAAILGLALPLQALGAGAVIGKLEIVTPNSDGTVTLKGWACQIGQSRSINFHVYVDASAYDRPAGMHVTSGKADLSNEAGVNMVCQAKGNHRFQVKVSAAIARANANKKIYVHGIRVVDGTQNSAVKNSGILKFPAAQAAPQSIQQPVGAKPAASVSGRKRQLIRDPHFVGGINFQGNLLKTFKDLEVKQSAPLAKIAADQQYAWSLAEWEIPRRLSTNMDVIASKGGHVYGTGNQFAQVRIGLPKEHDYEDRGLYLAINATEAWGGTFRRTGERWPHLLLKQDISPETGGSTAIGQLKNLNFSFKARVRSFRFDKSAGYDPKLHTLQYPIYLRLVSKVDKKDKMWLGIPVLNARHIALMPKTGISFTSMESSVMYHEGYMTPDAQSLLMHPDQWVNVSVDLIPVIARALAEAKKNNLYRSYDLNDYVVSYLNLGFEAPGMGTAGVQIKDLSLVETPK